MDANMALGAAAAVAVAAAAFRLLGGRAGRPRYQKDHRQWPRDEADPVEDEDFCPPFRTVNVHKEAELDAALEAALADKGAHVYVLVSASLIPFAGAAWCPDSRRAEPLIREALRRRHEKAGDRVVIVLARAKRYMYGGNPQHPYRVHPQMQLKACPTLYRWGPGGPEWSLVESECYDEALLADKIGV